MTESSPEIIEGRTWASMPQDVEQQEIETSNDGSHMDTKVLILNRRTPHQRWSSMMSKDPSVAKWKLPFKSTENTPKRF